MQAFKAPSSSAASRTAFHVVAQKRVQKKAQVRPMLGWLSRPKRSAVWSAIQCYGHCIGCCYFCIAQVVLKQDVPGLGSEGSLKSVPVGYWRNYLQPQGLAAFADAGILEAIRRKLEEEERLRLEEKAKAQAMVGLTRCESRLFGQELPA